MELQPGSSTSDLIWSIVIGHNICLSTDSNDLFLKESIEMLSEAGIKFDKHAARGIDPQLFSEYLIASGINIYTFKCFYITFYK